VAAAMRKGLRFSRQKLGFILAQIRIELMDIAGLQFIRPSNIHSSLHRIPQKTLWPQTKCGIDFPECDNTYAE
jgi:hypothetical protein